MKLVTAEEMRSLEERCVQEGISTDSLMENAGLAVAQKVGLLLGDARGHPVLVLIGPGNNGGDGLVAARHLADWGAEVTAYVTTPRRQPDLNHSLLLEHGGSSHNAEEDPDFSALDSLLAGTHLVIDAVLGTGRARPLQGTIAEVLLSLAQARERRPELRLLALDVPTGLNADTGQVDPLCPTVDVTVTLGLPKVGLFAFPGAEMAGRVDVVDIGIPAHMTLSMPRELATDTFARLVLPPRPANAHKGTFGRLLVIAGSHRYLGAAVLACQGAARVGTGLVTIAVPASLQPLIASSLTETTYLPLPEEDGRLSAEAVEVVLAEAQSYDALLVGCGLGQREDVAMLLRQVLLSARYPGTPLVLDADALNILAQVPEWWLQLRAPAIVTPHPGEMSRLTGKSTAEVNADRLRAATESAALWGVTVTLKGAYTVVASPNGRARVNPFSNPGLASAGTGDVLAGATAGLLAQGVSPFDAASCAAYVHGTAGEMAREEMGDTGMLATDLLPRLPLAIKRLREGTPGPVGTSQW